MKLKITNLRKQFDDFFAVRHISFEIESGEIVAFVGPNGAGKTTTLRILATLSQPSFGNVFLEGRSIVEFPEFARQHIGFVPDSLPLENDISVHEYLDFFARAYKIKGKERKVLLEELEEFTNLTDIKDKLLPDLSKGMKQRVTLARALINDPDFLLLDEPAAGLDPRARIELRELLKTLANRGKGILISSHILSELSEICSNAVFIEQGKLLKSGSIDQLVTESSESSNENRRITIRVLENQENMAKRLLTTPNVENTIVSKSSVEIEYSGDDASAAELLQQLIVSNFKVVEFKFQKQNLESLFMNITKGKVQ